jgi:hypothetical protein
VSEGEADPTHFFAAYPRFIDTSETGPWQERLDARYRALIEANRDLIVGARVLDLASHDGRFSFAALQAGAAHVVGIDAKAHLVRAGIEHFEAYGVAPDRYRFLVGDLYDWVGTEGPFDVVFCFGLLYHVNDHMQLLTRIGETEPRAIIIDTNVSKLDGALIEVRSPLGPGVPAPGSHLEGYPTCDALEAMMSFFGWTSRFFDWAGSGLVDRPHMADYRDGGRVSVVVECPEHAVPDEVRAEAVAAVLAAPEYRDRPFLTISAVAPYYDITPQALRVWVHRAERRAWRDAQFSPADQ